MDEKQKNTMTNEAEAGLTNAPLNEKELEAVSGGFELPTIIDLCQNRFVYQRCVDTPWGSCKNLSRVLVKKEETILQTVNHYKGTCAKGCFTDFLYEDYL
jgi:bacteriocin-like protein